MRNIFFDLKFKKRVLVGTLTFLLIIILFFVMNGALGFDYFYEEYSEEPIYLIVDSWAGYIPLYVAYENGFFEDEGVLVKFDIFLDSEEIGEKISQEDSPYDGYPGVYPQSLVSGDIDFNSSVVYVFDYSYGGDVIISSSSIKTIADLKGKTVSVVFFNSFSHRFLLELLEKNGLSENDVKIVEASAYDVVNLIKSGEIDAGHTWDPIKSEAIEQGFSLLATSKETPGLIIDVLTIKNEVIEKRESDIQKIVNALHGSYYFIKENRQEAYSLMANRTGVSFEELISVSSGIKLVDPDENILMMTDSGDAISLYNISKTISNFMVKHNQLEEGFLAEDLIDSRFINKKSFFNFFN